MQEQGLEFPAPTGFHVVSARQHLRRAVLPIRVSHPDAAVEVTLEPTAPMRRGWCRIEIDFPPQGLVDVAVQLRCSDGSQFWHRLTAIDRNCFILTVRIGGVLNSVALRISGSGYLTRPLKFNFKRVDPVGWVSEVLAKARSVVADRGLGVVRSAANFARALMRPIPIVISPSAANKGESPFHTWMRIFDEKPEEHRRRHEERLRSLKRRPLISCLATLSSVNELLLVRLAHSMNSQIYPQWELIVAVPEAGRTLAAESLLSKGLDQRCFRIVAARHDESSTLAALLEPAAGTYVLQLPEAALLRSNALLELALTVALYPEAKIVYSDEDQIDDNGQRREPKFKPAWSPDFFPAYDYIGHLLLISRNILLDVGGWRANFFDSINHDLILRIASQTGSRHIVHIAKILVSVRCKQAASPNRAAVERMLREYVERCGLEADPVWREEVALPQLRYRIPVPAPIVSLIIPTRDRADLLEVCVRSIMARTNHNALEILIVDNGSAEDRTHQLFSELGCKPGIRILPSPGEFNYSALNNLAAREAKGTILGLLNNDVEVLHADWLEEMVSLAVRPQVGCVGAKLLYPDGRVQHAGVYLGVGNLAAHAYRFAPANMRGQLNRMATVQNVSAVTAACLLIRKSLFEEVGGLDEQLKVALSDVDLCLKVKAAGYLNLWTPFAELVHHESPSRGHDTTVAKAKRLAHEQRVLSARWGEQLLSDPYYSPNLSTDHADFSVRVH
jgi:GT2 family glycosyltransferase